MRPAVPPGFAIRIGTHWRDLPMLAPFRDASFRRYLAAFFVFGSSNLFYSGIIAPVFSHDLGYGYTDTTLSIHIIPALGAFAGGGRLTDRLV
jgi:hypothetical protein